MEHQKLWIHWRRIKHQQKMSKPARRSTMNHFGHTYNDGASSKTLQSMFLMKEQLMLSQWDYDEQI
jgi:hypothetical protein